MFIDVGDYRNRFNTTGKIYHGYNCVYMHTHLAQGTFFERIKMGIKYIFRYQSRYGVFDEFILSEEQAPQLRELADAIDACKKENYRRAAEQL